MASITALGRSCTGAAPSTSCSFQSGSSSLKVLLADVQGYLARKSCVAFQGIVHIEQVDRGVARVSCRKDDIHPKWFSGAKVYCNGELVMTTGGTQAEYVVDVWSGNHPFFQGNKSTLLLDTDRVDKFKQRYGMVGRLAEIPTLTQGEIVFEKKKKQQMKGKGGAKKK